MPQESQRHYSQNHKKKTTSFTKKKRNFKVDKHKSLQLEPGQGSHCNLTALLDLYDTVDLKDAQSLLLHEFWSKQSRNGFAESTADNTTKKWKKGNDLTLPRLLTSQDNVSSSS